MPENSSQFNPVSHFFTIPTLISQTTSQQAFGPQTPTLYNISSGFTAMAGAKAFAICKGIVLIQPQTGSTTKVNLILRPYVQPVQGINIKYFIYRGLNRSDFFDNDQVLETGSDFITKIRLDFTKFYENDPIDPNPDFLAKYIGFNTANQPDTLLLDEFFFKESEYVESNGEFIEDPDAFGSFELPLIDGGASLGNFSEGECAIDVVLNYGDYKPEADSEEFIIDLTYARAAKASITISELDTLQDKLKKEQIFQFLDITAYYGSHTTGGTVIIDNAGAKLNLTGTSIYTNTLTNFLNKNKLYLYIQSDRTRSYNFYGNYNIGETANTLKFGTVPETLTERVYGTLGWPVIIESPTTPSVYIQLVTDNNVNTMLYGQAADIKNAANNNFCNADNLLLPPNEDGILSTFTKVLELGNPISDNNGPVIANYNIVLYQGVTYEFIAGTTVDENDDTVNLYAQPNFFDDVFDLINAEPIMKGKNLTDYTVITSQKIKLINEYYDRKQQGVSAVQTLVVKDSIETGDETNPLLKRVAYITETIDVLNNSASLVNRTSSSTISSSGAGGSVNPGKTYRLPEPYYYELQSFTDSLELINGIKLKIFDRTNPNKIILGITHTENELLKILISSTLQNPRLFLIDLFEDGNQLISSEGILYQKYKVGVVSEKSDGDLQLSYPSTDIMVYSLDRSYHFSKDYCEFIKLPSIKDTIEISL